MFEFHQATNHTFDPYMPIVVVGALLGGIVLAILSPGVHSLSGELAVAGSVCNVAVLASKESLVLRGCGVAPPLRAASRGRIYPLSLKATSPDGSAVLA
jgi:hypothetical protein